MKLATPILLLTFLVVLLACRKEKTCIDVSLVPPCVAAVFPESGADLGFTSANTAIDFLIESTTRQLHEMVTSTSDDCFTHETLSTVLRDMDNKYELVFSYPAQNFNGVFYIYFKDILADTEDRFSIYLKEECSSIETFFMSEEEGETFIDSIMIEGQSYQNVYKMANQWIHDGSDFNDNNKFQFVYYSIEDGIILFESADESWVRKH
ncbi:MAG: hypothetical protein AAF985_19945 [Bacteroidota bacterium]